MRILVLLLFALTVQAQVIPAGKNTFLAPTPKPVWGDHPRFASYTGIFISISKDGKGLPKCGDINIPALKKGYDENIGAIKAKYPNAKFRQVILRYPPVGVEVELTFEQFQEILCK